MNDRILSTPKDFLDEAKFTIAQRAATRDVQQERSFAATASIYSELRRKPGEDRPTSFDDEDAILVMISLKLARANAAKAKNKWTPDDYVDLIAYCALLAEARFESLTGGGKLTCGAIDAAKIQTVGFESVPIDDSCFDDEFARVQKLHPSPEA